MITTTKSAGNLIGICKTSVEAEYIGPHPINEGSNARYSGYVKRSDIKGDERYCFSTGKNSDTSKIVIYCERSCIRLLDR